MKTTLIQATRAYQAIGAFSEIPMDYASAHALVLMKRELEPHVAFFAEKEAELIRRYAETDDNGDPVTGDPGQYRLRAAELPDFLRERAELNGVEVEITGRKLQRLPETISPAALEALLAVFQLPEEGNDEQG